MTIVDAGIGKPLDVEVDHPGRGHGRPLGGRRGAADTGGTADPRRRPLRPRSSIWPSIYPRILDQVLEHRSTIIFCNARRQAERLAAKLNELAEERGIGVDPETGRRREDLVKAHHGSLAREQRIVVEDQLKRGDLRAIVATSSLELGIDMGAVDLVIQVESPGAVSRGLQRIGRAGHQVGEPSKGSIYPKHRGDLLEAAVVTRRMLDGEIESTRYLRNPLDVLAQQIVAHTAARGETPVAELAALVRRTANFAELSDEQLANTLDLLAGRYPSEEFSELRPRVVWNRVTDTVRARDGAKRLAVTSGGTIPDRGLFGVFLPDGTRGRRARRGDGLREPAGRDVPARRLDVAHRGHHVRAGHGHAGAGRAGQDAVLARRPARAGRSSWGGRSAPSCASCASSPPREAIDRAPRGLRPRRAGRGQPAAVRQRAGRGHRRRPRRPHDRHRALPRRDRRLADLHPQPVRHAGPRTVGDGHRASLERPVRPAGRVDVGRRRHRVAPARRPPTSCRSRRCSSSPRTSRSSSSPTLPQTALFSSRFRECAGRALLLPRRRPDQRTPLWQQRQKAADLLAVAAKYPTFPILLEASRECLQDVFDVPALRDVLGQLRSRAVRVVSVDTTKPSPMAQSLLFNWIAAYMYEGDAPLAERRAAALALDRDLLRDLLGAEELRELLDPGVLADVELDLQHLSDGRRARSADELHDVLRRVGDLTATEVDLRCEQPGRAVDRRADRREAGHRDRHRRGDPRRRRRGRRPLSGRPRVRAAARPARGVHRAGAAAPRGPRRPLRADPRPVHRARGRRTASASPRRACSAPWPRSRPTGGSCAASSARRACGASGATPRCCASCGGARWRRCAAEVEPVEPAALARFLPAWHGIPPERRGVDAVVEALGLLAGAPIVGVDARVRRAVVARSATTGRRSSTSCARRATCSGSAPAPSARPTDGCGCASPTSCRCWRRGGRSRSRPDGALHDALRTVLAERGASFWNQLRAGAPGTADDELLAALWDLVWAGEVTNDSLAPLRAFTQAVAAAAPPEVRAAAGPARAG